MTIRQHAARIVDGLDPSLKSMLASEPLDALQTVGLQVASLDSSKGGTWCDGMSTTENGIILYLATPDSRRENFTLLHEYAHTLVDADDEAMIWLADQPDDKTATEQLCNAVAALLLVPAGVIDRIAGAGPIRAQHLLDLHRETQASQTAIAIALARRLTTDGAVLIVDRGTNTVVHAALVGELAVWPWKNQTVPDTHSLRRLQPGSTLTTRSWWATPWDERQTFYLDAVSSAKRVYAILAVTDIWNVETFHGGDHTPERDHQPTDTRSCPCGYSGPMTGWPCPTCHRNFCPKCKKCLCDIRNAKDEKCRNCGMTYARTALKDQLCSECQ